MKLKLFSQYFKKNLWSIIGKFSEHNLLSNFLENRLKRTNIAILIGLYQSLLFLFSIHSTTLRETFGAFAYALCCAHRGKGREQAARADTTGYTPGPDRKFVYIKCQFGKLSSTMP